jgi:hypothetical protein
MCKVEVKDNTRTVYSDGSSATLSIGGTLINSTDWQYMEMKYPTPIPVVESVIFNNPYTIVNWEDGTKTIVRCAEDEKFVEEVGFLAALGKKVFGTRGAYLKIVEDAHRQISKTETAKNVRKLFKKNKKSK